MVFAVLIILALLFPQTVQAQSIPLSFQLMMAFRPSTSITIIPIVTPTPASKVLGISTTQPSPISTPTNVGGEGKMVTIAVLGDSMIDTLGAGIPSLTKALQPSFPLIKFNILNYGYGASNIEQALDRLSHSYTYRGNTVPDLISQQPDIVIIESFAYNNFGNSQIGFDRQWTALGSLTGTIHQLLPSTHIMIAATIAPNSISFANGSTTQFSSLQKVEKTSTIKLYLENAINFAKSEKYPFIDAYHPSIFGGNGNANYINTSDHIHPSTLGAKFFADLAAKAIVNTHWLD